MTIFKGSGVAIVTPFKEGTVDFDALGNLIDWQIAQSIDAIVICGTTGEASTLSDEEHIETVSYTVKKVNGRVPVIGGAGSNDTEHAVQMSKALSYAGVDGLLLVTPYYNKCSQTGLIRHYTHIADSVETPCLMYSVPGRTGVNITPDTVKELCTHPNIVGLKEASGNIAQVVEIAQYISDDFALYSGNDDMTVPLLSVGGTGMISTVANVAPYDTHRMVMTYLDGEIETAKKLQLALFPLIKAMFLDINPIPVKAALNMMGYIEAEYRLPLCEPDSKTLYSIMHELRAYGLLPTIY